MVSPHPFIAEDAVLDDLVPGRAEMDMTCCVGWPVHEEIRRVILMEFFYLFISPPGAPVLLHGLLDSVCLVAAGDFFHRDPPGAPAAPAGTCSTTIVPQEQSSLRVLPGLTEHLYRPQVS
jgi:hypothetical protein